VTEYSGSGDPARSLALLWRSGERPSRSGLSVDRIVRAAIEVADADGLGALSMRRVAERLGAGTMSLYTHVPGKAEVLDLMLDSAYGELARPDDVAGGWRARLEHVARERWALYRRHPWMLQVAVSRPPLGPNVTANYEYELRAIADIGLTELEMDSIVTLVADHVEGAARRALDAALAEQRTGMSDQEWWDAHAPILNQVFDPARYPTAVRVGTAAGEAHQAAYNPEHAFEFGLQRVLDGIEAFVAKRVG
jgi:AcrR family transcriptional regulator